MWKHGRWFGIAILAATMLAATGMSLATEDAGPSARLIPSSRVTPVYPPAAFAARFGGEVTLAAHVRADGTVGDIEVLESTRPNLGFEQASKDAVAKWQFEPAELDGEAVKSYAVFRLAFGVERSSAGRHGVVGGTFMTGGLFPSPSPSSTTAKGTGGGRNGNTTASRQVKGQVVKVKMPSVCEGCLYDRSDLFPAASEPPVHPN